MKAAPKRFSLQENNHQGVYSYTVHNTHDTQVILHRHNTDNVCTISVSTLNQACIFS